MGLLLCWVCFTLFFFSLDWVCNLLFRIDVGPFFPGGLALLQFFFFCLKVEQIIYIFFI